jgi:hypothetical protein
MATQDRPSAGETIRQAMLGLRNAGRQISRQRLVELTKLPMSIVDDHVTRMIEQEGSVRRVANGVVEMVDVFPPSRAISRTSLSEGWTMLEVPALSDEDKRGDVVLHLTPGECREIGKMFHGDAAELANLRGERETHDLVARLERKVGEQQRLLALSKKQLTDLAKTVARLSTQPQLEFE